MTEIKYNNCTIRIHEGTVDKENLKAATEVFVKKVMMQKRRVVKSA